MVPCAWCVVCGCGVCGYGCLVGEYVVPTVFSLFFDQKPLLFGMLFQSGSQWPAPFYVHNVSPQPLSIDYSPIRSLSLSHRSMLSFSESPYHTKLQNATRSHSSRKQNDGRSKSCRVVSTKPNPAKFAIFPEVSFSHAKKTPKKPQHHALSSPNLTPISFTTRQSRTAEVSVSLSKSRDNRFENGLSSALRMFWCLLCRAGEELQ